MSCLLFLSAVLVTASTGLWNKAVNAINSRPLVSGSSQHQSITGNSTIQSIKYMITVKGSQFYGDFTFFFSAVPGTQMLQVDERAKYIDGAVLKKADNARGSVSIRLAAKGHQEKIRGKVQKIGGLASKYLHDHV